jgi:Contractile injection system tube protein/LysM domain
MAKTRGDLEAARIYAVSEDGNDLGSLSVDCMFNPFEYTISKSNTYEEKPGNGTDVPIVEFKKAGAQTLKLKLTFDTYDKASDVTLLTNKLWKLMEAKENDEAASDNKKVPPWVAFEWGVFKFVSVITNMTQKFTMFLKDGTPVRAAVDVTFTQYADLNDYPGQNPTSGGGPIERVRTVIAGDRLDVIAAEVYGDATRWRSIASYNGIINPLVLRPGTRLSIPQL